MAHGLENSDDMLYFGDVPWHNLGTRVPRHLTYREACDFVPGLGDRVGKRPLMYESIGHGTQPVKGHVALVNERTGRAYGVATDEYQVIQTADAFATFGDIFGQAAVLETAGCLHGGATVWGCARFPVLDVCGDTHLPFVVVTTDHTGRAAMRAYPSMTRVVCRNTLNLSLTDASKGISVRHTGNVTAKLAQASATLATTLGMFEAYRANAATLDRVATSTVGRVAFEEAMAELFGTDSKAADVKSKVVHLMRHGRGNDNRAATLYTLFQGVTDYVDHSSPYVLGSRGRDASKLATYATFGPGARLKTRALDVLLKLAA